MFGAFNGTKKARTGVLWKVLSRLFVVVVGISAGVVGWSLWKTECGGVFSEFRHNDDFNRECIGITDGDYLFNDITGVGDRRFDEADREIMERINDVQRMIAVENASVGTESRYVKVVLLMPLTVSQAQPSAVSLDQILHSLQGSYTALMRTNHSHYFGDPSAVKVQLLLANQGSQLEASPDFIEGIMSASEPEHPVVAVVGLGVSRQETVRVVEQLGAHGIPMVGAVTSADPLTGMPFFWSVSPSDTQYAKAIKNLLDHQHVLKSGIIVYDNNGDLFTTSLAQAYRTELKPYIKYPDQPFQGSTVPTPVAHTVFDPVVRNICNAYQRTADPLRMIFYAGREADFGAFAEALAVRTCNGPLAVLVGSTGFASEEDIVDRLDDIKITVLNAASSDPVNWAQENHRTPTPVGYTEFVASCVKYASGEESELADGYAIAHHDALATAAQAIRLAAGDVPTVVPDGRNVARRGFGYLTLAHEVRAASGSFSFPPQGGRPIGRGIPIKQINPATWIELPEDIPPFLTGNS